MEKAWVFSKFAVTACLVDFLDPALADTPDPRERGVRLEIRPVEEVTTGSIYSSPSIGLRPAVLRADLLESSPGRADRMHFHPNMVDGEPGDRVFDETIPQDPIGWVRNLLLHPADKGVRELDDAAADAAEEIAGEVQRILEQARRPWPEVTHDERGLVVG